jgi:hypothetical protein
MGRVQTRLSKSRLSRCPCGCRSVILASAAALLIIAIRYPASADERTVDHYDLVSTIASVASSLAALNRVPALL